MSLLNQKTIKETVKFSGVGLHNGKLTNLIIKPSKPNTGIVFKRIDIDSNNIVYPSFSNVSNTSLNTTISNEHGIKISTIEHLMGALYGLGIDNAIIEINSQEVPIMDGSAKKFVELILQAGIHSSEVPIKIIKVDKYIEVKEGDKSISIRKSNVSLDIDFEIKYQNEFIKSQRNKISVFEDDLNEIYESRTFCLYEDIEKLKKMGLGKGGRLENALVVKGNSLINEDGLRNQKEFVNHKILDCMGDLYLSGFKMIGSLTCSQGGHYLTNKLLRKLFSDRNNYSLIEIKGKNLPHSLAIKNQLRSIA